MFVRDPAHDSRRCRYTDDVKETLIPYLEQYDHLGELILSIEWVVRRNPEDEETQAIGEDDPNMLYISRVPRPELDLPIPKITFLYEYDDEEVIFWAVKIEDV